MNITKRNGTVVPFNAERILVSAQKAYVAVHNIAPSDTEWEQIEQIKEDIVTALEETSDCTNVDIVHNLTIAALTECFPEVGQAYAAYRQVQLDTHIPEQDDMYILIHSVIDNDDLAKKVYSKVMRSVTGKEGELRELLALACSDVMIDLVDRDKVVAAIHIKLTVQEVYSQLVNKEVPLSLTLDETDYQRMLPGILRKGMTDDRYDARLLNEMFDIIAIMKAIKPERDYMLDTLGFTTLYDRYLVRVDGKVIETPQMMFMRIAMGLALAEDTNKTKWAIEFYEVLSNMYFLSSTPTLFNSGLKVSQLASCFVQQFSDSITGIFEGYSQMAQTSKWAGGIGYDITPVRGSGAYIRGTNGTSQGIIPWTKIVNDIAIAVNQGGKRRGAIAGYLATWHIDIEEFLLLRRNTGDDRRRTYDMNTANWIPDLFMERMLADDEWTLFSPDETPTLLTTYGVEFNREYSKYEELAEAGKIKIFKKVSAKALWREMISLLYETGHPWINFSTPANVRYPNKHHGMVNSSNLCTEIFLHSSPDETAVCNLGSINVTKFMSDSRDKYTVLDRDHLREVVTLAVRMLDNVVSINKYPTVEAERSNMKHRPIGLGMMGFQDSLYKLGIPFDSSDAVKWSDILAEHIYYYATLASAELAQERGSYETFKGSTWSNGLVTVDTMDDLASMRLEGDLDWDNTTLFDWDNVRGMVRKGMRNSTIGAIAPTATIANIAGVSQGLDPQYRNIYTKSNLSGEFTVYNKTLINELKSNYPQVDLVQFELDEGDINTLEGQIPQSMIDLYQTAFDIPATAVVDAAGARQKWLDQGQSINLYFSNPTGKLLSDTYIRAWRVGLKSTYYLYSTAATNSKGNEVRTVKDQPKVCSILDPTCESCQ